MPIGAAIGASAVIGGVVASSSASKAAKASQNATDASVSEENSALAAQTAEQDKTLAAQTAESDKTLGIQQDNLQRGIDTANEQFGAVTPQNVDAWNTYGQSFNPFITAGTSALGEISSPDAVNANFAASPDYNFRLSQGENAVNTDKAVNGLLRSGGALKAVNDYAQGTASNEFANWWARQAGLANTGLTALNDQGTAVAGANNARQAGALAITNATLGAGTNLSNAAGAAGSSLNSDLTSAGNITSNAIGSNAANVGNLLTSNATNQGNAALATGTAVNSGIGSIAELLAKYGSQNTGSSYSGASSGANPFSPGVDANAETVTV